MKRRNVYAHNFRTTTSVQDKLYENENLKRRIDIFTKSGVVKFTSSAIFNVIKH